MSGWRRPGISRYILRIISAAEANPKDWETAVDNTWAKAIQYAYDKITIEEYHNVWGVTSCMQGTDAWYGVHGAVTALVAFDNCAYLLDEKPVHVQLLASLGVEAAVLMRTASSALCADKNRELHV